MIQEKWKVKGSKEKSRGIKSPDMSRLVKRSQEESRGVKKINSDIL